MCFHALLYKAPAECRDTISNINGSPIPCIRDGVLATFLGKSIGSFLPRDTVTIDFLKQRAVDIMTSKLGPWQRIDCLKTFYYPSMLFMMRTDQLSKSDWRGIDNSVRPLLKRTLGLPPNAANEYLYGARDDGLLGVPLAAEDSDIAIIDGGGQASYFKG